MPTSTARAKLLDTAQRLFYEDGITTTGVDRIVAEAGVSKPTLYAHFGTKDALIDAVLRRRHERRPAELTRWLDEHTDNPRDRLLGVFDWLAGWQRSQGNRGCAFVNAATEVRGGPVLDTIRGHKGWWRGYLAGLAASAGVPDPDSFGADLLLLIDGVNGRLLVDGDPEVVTRAKRLATVLLDAALDGSR